MPAPFSRTIRSLEAEKGGRRAAILVTAAVLLGGWLLWFFLARVAVYEVGQARIEVTLAAHSVETSRSGRVVAEHLVLDQTVSQGDVLVELDASAERHKLAEAKAHLSGIDAQLKALADQVKAAERAASGRKSVLAAKIGEAEARVREAQSAAQLADGEASRAEKLHSQGVLSEAELAKSSADARTKRAASQAQETAASRAAAELRANDGELAAELSRLAQRAAELSAAREEEEAAIRLIEHAIEEHIIRAPIRGKIAQVATIPAGTVLKQGDRVASIVPQGELFAVAELAPGDALGRVKQGQSARIRMEGFTWTEYGSIPATVTGVAGEIRDGKVRVELMVISEPGSPIPMQHGLPGTAEIEVEHASPAKLLLRAAGRYLRSGPGQPPEPP